MQANWNSEVRPQHCFDVRALLDSQTRLQFLAFNTATVSQESCAAWHNNDQPGLHTHQEETLPFLLRVGECDRIYKMRAKTDFSPTQGHQLLMLGGSHQITLTQLIPLRVGDKALLGRAGQNLVPSL